MLITAINSDLPGPVVGQVRENVYDTVSGNVLLVPQGARLLANYDSMVAWGQERVLLCWNRLLLPNGDSLRLQCMPAADLKGAAGLADEVDEHWFRIVKGAAVASLLAATTQGIAGSTTTFNPDRAAALGRGRRGRRQPGRPAADAPKPEHPADHHRAARLLRERHGHKGHCAPALSRSAAGVGAWAMTARFLPPRRAMTARELGRLQFRLLVATACASALACIVAGHLIWNRTPSLPEGLYWLSRGSAAAPGKLVAFPVPADVAALVRDRQYLPPGAVLVKSVVATAGDWVCTRGGTLSVNGQELGAVLTEDSAGRPLPHYE